MTNTTRPIITADMVAELEAKFLADIEQSKTDAAIARQSDRLALALGQDPARRWANR